MKKRKAISSAADAKREHRRKKPTAADRKAKWEVKTRPVTAEMKREMDAARTARYGTGQIMPRVWDRHAAGEALHYERNRHNRYMSPELAEDIERNLHRVPFRERWTGGYANWINDIRRIDQLEGRYPVSRELLGELELARARAMRERS
jgi:hypothetical protein